VVGLKGLVGRSLTMPAFNLSC